MCFLVTVTLMTYCLRKATTGSCVMELCVLTFIITLPLVVLSIALYLALPYFVEDENSKKMLLGEGIECDGELPELKGICNPEQFTSKCNGLRFRDGTIGQQLIKDHNELEIDYDATSDECECDGTRVIGLIEKIYPDALQFKFKCSGLNFGENMGVLLSECFDAAEPIPEKYYITSKSRYWCENNIIHSIVSFKEITENTGSIMVLEADPPLPEPCFFNYEDRLPKEDDYFYVEEHFRPDAEHVLVGWRIRDRHSKVPFQEIPVLSYCIPGYPSAIIFSRLNNFFTGFQKDCSADERLGDVIVPYSMFLDKIRRIYPNVEYKSNKAVRIINNAEYDDEYDDEDEYEDAN
ncbi:unnamed protein product [Phyllotreta striolata]|uniref:Uncharacterized protein n=1 Tax=Phyllotreta striolata TaxID=444603 RepID=A0A9N9XKS0_PHYSR|nr:unnamed protein product [Phyllotreta striolata]